jgi:oxygen-independent coproporphyrinogen-3 oxidase
VSQPSAAQPETSGIYLHIPFCRARCTYCDFNTYIGMESLYAPYARALTREIRAQDPSSRPRPSTLFFGGGTPSLLSPEQLGGLIDACRDHLRLADDAEVTAECNPGTVTREYLAALRAHGVNRLSFGAQSADPDELKLLGREHGFDDVARAVDNARAAGYDDVNFDLIFGLPYQSVDSWRRTLDAAMPLVPTHISLYALTIEQGTPMYDWTRRGEVPFPDPDLAADMYDIARERLAAHGFAHYEISNWCKPGREAKHNLIYWRNLPYFGLGAGAHDATVGRRTWKVRRPADYIARAEAGDSLEHNHEDLDARTSRGETMMLGLRLLTEGVDQARFERRYGAPIAHFFEQELARGVELGVLDVTPERIRLTERGTFVSNLAMRLFV